MTARKYDLNGWYEIEENPISRSGIFEYLGREISPSLEPEKVYRVYRPESELNNPEAIESFKMIPWLSHHEMIGTGETPAESAGVQGTTGERIQFRNGILYANIKVYGQRLMELIQDGIKELSVGFRCAYEIVSGIAPDGQPYDVIQKNIRGNHLALVPQGRAGQQVAVMDHSRFAFDAASVINHQPEKGNTMDMEQLIAAVKGLQPLSDRIDKMQSAIDELTTKKAEDEEAKKKEAEAEEAKDKCAEDEDEDGEKEAEKKEKGAMDAAAAMDAIKALTEKVEALEAEKAAAMDEKAIAEKIERKNAMVEKVSAVIGDFDHKAMDEQAVAVYAAKKLGIPCEESAAVAVMDGYFAARKNPTYTVDKGDNQNAEASAALGAKFNKMYEG